MKNFIAVSALFFLTACAGVRIYSPNPRVEPPELRGDRGVKITNSLVGSHALESTSNGHARPPDLEHPETATAFDFFSGFSYSPVSQLETGIELSPLQLGLAAVAKWQPLGSGSRYADEGNVPLSLYVRVGHGDSKNNGDTLSYYDFRGKMSESYVHSGISLGYRPLPHMLIYGGFAYGQYWARAEVSQGASGMDPGGTYKSSYRGHGTTSGGGLLFNWRVIQFYVSGELTHIDYNKSRGMQDLYLHTGLYITPGGIKTAPAP